MCKSLVEQIKHSLCEKERESGAKIAELNARREQEIRSGLLVVCFLGG